MAYSFKPQPQLSLLDDQYIPTETLRSFSDAVFDYLDTHCEPKGTQLLEPEKMQTLVSFALGKEELQDNITFSSLLLGLTFLAYQVETVFNSHGPSVTRAGLLTYLRSKIMGNPVTALRDFKAYNKAMRLGSPFIRSQFPRVADLKTKELASYVQASFDKATNIACFGLASEGGGEESGEEDGYGYNHTDKYGSNDTDEYGYKYTDEYGYKDTDEYEYNDTDEYEYNDTDEYGYKDTDEHGYKDTDEEDGSEHEKVNEVDLEAMKLAYALEQKFHLAAIDLIDGPRKYVPVGVTFENPTWVLFMH
ncbi:hypothetical protein BX616_001554 [Lobosporangium transversale]|uniref:Uncharacterized protein n=1 Tax=Lobosporangium transversale TaxID=64571 RepID=A0A1Y2GKD3_9FUNG|nr:hypothetical protein BCR41DRAFT_408993 [Lobosporangium transversale]KAF9917254.1 hypothetical protein BX616_001554 [Lobosporangium transversale]ORZ11404.1 hypothetical protein BCR41DRAFT_408993 [Lobosporangium transversale]|eukprot:XP_021879719.1 hypothetical protein BCR41DRAFT_408993 [Lobosporangium transversale]